MNAENHEMSQEARRAEIGKLVADWRMATKDPKSTSTDFELLIQRAESLFGKDRGLRELAKYLPEKPEEEK